VTYAVLSVAYKFYLDFSNVTNYYPDYFTNLVARQSEMLFEVLGYNVEVVKHTNEASMKIFIENKFVARLVEGCNSVSIIILFISFIIAFADSFKATLIYILALSVLIYIVILLRIVILSIGLYHYPWRRDILHTIIFPLIIYGMVFLLWMLWVRRYAKIHKQNE